MRPRHEGAAQLIESHIGEPIERPDDLRRLAAEALRKLDVAHEALEGVALLVDEGLCWCVGVTPKGWHTEQCLRARAALTGSGGET